MKIDETQEESMSATSRRNFLMGILVPVAMSACQSASAPEKAARQFMENYYVQMSLEGAKKLSTGLAKEKLESQIKLLDGQSITAGTNVPKVDFHLVSSDPGQGEDVSYVFEVIPRAEDVGKRKVFVKLRQENGQWLVSQFAESNQTLP